MRKTSRFLAIIVWLTLIYIFFKLNLLSSDMNNFNNLIINHGAYKELIFVAISSLRVIVFIPSAVFMILGGRLFNPFEGFALTLVSIILSETIVYKISKILIGSNIENYLVNQYPRLYGLLLKNNIRILALGIICPIAPSDVACFLASSTGLNYGKFILTVIIANMPNMILYSFLGNSVVSLADNAIVIAVAIIIISIYSICLWNKEKREENCV